MKPPVFSLLSSRVTDNGSLYGRFLLGPLPIDISVTLATILRRSLLHSKQPFSIISAEIEGANHEYASLPGVQESVLEILLNLGEIVLTSPQRNVLNQNTKVSDSGNVYKNRHALASGPPLAFLKISGPCVVTAKDIWWPTGIQCVKPNAYIATLSSNASLTMRLKITSYKNLYPSKAKGIKHLGLQTNFLGGESRKHLGLENSSLNSRFSGSKSKQIFEISRRNAFIKSSKGYFTNSFKPQILSETSKPQIYNRVLGKSVRNILPLWGSQIPHFQDVQKKIPPKAISNSSVKNSAKEYLEKNSSAHTKTLSPRAFGNTSIINNKVLTKNSLINQNRISGFSVFSEPDQKNKEEAETTKKQAKESLAIESTKTEQKRLHSFGTVIQPQGAVNASGVLSPKKIYKTQTFKFLEEVSPRVAGGLAANSSKKDPLSIPSKKKFYGNSVTPIGLTKNLSPISVPPFGVELPVSSSSYPVEKVNFLIERDDSFEGYRHRIIFEVWTNGSISPRQAIFEGIGPIIKLLFNFREPTRSSLMSSP